MPNADCRNFNFWKRVVLDTIERAAGFALTDADSAATVRPFALVKPVGVGLRERRYFHARFVRLEHGYVSEIFKEARGPFAVLLVVVWLSCCCCGIADHAKPFRMRGPRLVRTLVGLAAGYQPVRQYGAFEPDRAQQGLIAAE